MKALLVAFEKFETVSNKVLGFITNVMIAVLTLTVLSQVIGRYIFDVYLDWTEEASRYLMIWVVLLGAAKALREDAHPRVTFVLEILPVKAKYIVMLLANLACAFFFSIMIIYGWQFSSLNISQLSLSLRLPMGIIFLSLPLGGLFLLLNTIGDMIKNLKHLGFIPTVKEH